MLSFLVVLTVLLFSSHTVLAVDLQQLSDDQNYQYNLYRNAYSAQVTAETENQKNPSLPNQNHLFTTAKTSMAHRLAVAGAYLKKINFLLWNHPENIPKSHPQIANEISRQEKNINNLQSQLDQITTLNQLINLQNQFSTVFSEIARLRPQIIAILIEANLNTDLKTLNNSANYLYHFIADQEPLIPDKEKYYQWIAQVYQIVANSRQNIQPIQINPGSNLHANERQLDNYIAKSKLVETQLITAQHYLMDIISQMKNISQVAP